VLILGIETSCDETAAAIVRDGKRILSNVIASQAAAHQIYGGVVPELASREHLLRLPLVIQQAVSEARVAMGQLDAIAVTQGPGLIGALLVGIHTAKGLAVGLGRPLIPVNHIEAHLYAAMMAEKPPFPALGVVVSGGHTALLLIEQLGHYRLISSTVDDAIGEAFDKVAALLGLPYPGGPALERLARGGDPARYSLRAGQVKNHPFAFSFSGLKTSVLYVAKGVGSDKRAPLKIGEEELAHLAASFQEAALTDLVTKIEGAAAAYGCRALVLGGGVTQNQRLRALLARSALPAFWPAAGLSLDNAAMIAGLAYHCSAASLDFRAEAQLKPFWLN
jgi:N6-L-threonylcarbamoyladenine synthase